MYATFFIVTINTITVCKLLKKIKFAQREVWEHQNGKLCSMSSYQQHFLIFIRGKACNGILIYGHCWPEMVAANEGIGYMIWNARLYFKTDWIFVGLVILGLMGFLMDRIFNKFGSVVLKRYNVVKIKRAI